MRNLYRCLTLMALSIYLLISGSTGLCKVWASLALEHHHHSQAQLSQSHDSAHAHPALCSDAAADCDIPAIPCDDSHKEDGRELTALTPDSPAPIASPFVGLLPATVTVPPMSASLLTGGAQSHTLSDSSRRGSPPTLAAQLCRFLV